MKKKANYALVFDLDETIGHFAQLSVLIKIMEEYRGSKLSMNDKYKLLDLFPEFYRPGILKVFQYLLKIKTRDMKIIIYTNNMGPKSWVNMIKTHIEKKIGGKIFDTVIAGYRLGWDGIILEHTRTTSFITYSDLLNAASLTAKTKIMFFDDQWHNYMNERQIKYIQLKPYQLRLPFDYFIQKFTTTKEGKRLIKNPSNFSATMKPIWKKYKFTDIITAPKIEEKYTREKIYNNIRHSLKIRKTRRKKGTKSRKNSRKRI